eukprot:GILJ01011770.1.p1 GENE.GILJ01011770.1~~GILJ01011770.1.p1  ORF type:complete len:171 (-),score=32.50 GILJ01011770.1:96-608(-)
MPPPRAVPSSSSSSSFSSSSRIASSPSNTKTAATPTGTFFNSTVTGFVSTDSNGSGLLSSSQLLQRMRERRQTGQSASRSISVDDMDSATFGVDIQIDPRISTLVEEVHQFLLTRNGEASTQEILDQFKSRIGRNDMALFRQLLKQIADLTSEPGTSDGTKKWKLKPDFA